MNASLEDAVEFCRLLRPIGVTSVQLLPFHQYGERKYDLLGWEYKMADVPALHEEDLVDYIATFDQNGLHAYV